MEEDILNKKYKLAEHYQNIQNYQKAMDVCFEILSEYPEDLYAKCVLAFVYYDLHYTDTTKDYYNKSLELCCKLINSKYSKNIMNLMGNIYFEQGEYLKSRLTYEDLLSKEPNYAEAISSYGKALHALGQEKEAKIQYEKAMELEPNSYFILSDIYIGFHKFSMDKEYELNLLSRILEFGGDLFRIYVHFANTYYKYLDYENALKFNKKAIQINPTYKPLIEAADRIIIQMNHSKEIEEKRKLIVYYQKNNNYAEIINICLKMLEIIPDDIHIRYCLMYSYFALGFDYYDKAMEIANDLVNNTSILTQTGIEIVNGVEQSEFFYFNRIINLIGRINFYKEEYTEAKILYENHLKNHPNDVESIAGYGRVLYALGNKEQGIINLNKALELESDNITILWDFYSTIYFFSHDKDKEIELLNTILKLESNKFEICRVYTYLGHTYTKYKDYKMASEFFNEALKINPDNEELKNCMNYAKSNMKNYSDKPKGFSIFRKILNLLR